MRKWKTDTKDLNETAEAKRYAREGKVDVVSSGHQYDLGASLDAGEEIASEEIIRLPRDERYGELEATLEIHYMRRDRGRLDPKFELPAGYSWDKNDEQYYCSPDACGEYVVYHGLVLHNNNMVNVTRRPRYLASFWGPISGFDAFVSSFDFKKNTLNVYREGIDEAEAAREADSYGLGYIRTSSVMSSSEWLRLPED
ncbi:hypothetical protein [Streptomyces sp. NBC_00443]|uniref:hypothetical protein n=1 Tax=Streptomyces sp. NBC_00443 TaxID=2975743 RepID=UPI002E2518DF